MKVRGAGRGREGAKRMEDLRVMARHCCVFAGDSSLR